MVKISAAVGRWVGQLGVLGGEWSRTRSNLAGVQFGLTSSGTSLLARGGAGLLTCRLLPRGVTTLPTKSTPSPAGTSIELLFERRLFSFSAFDTTSPTGDAAPARDDRRLRAPSVPPLDLASAESRDFAMSAMSTFTSLATGNWNRYLPRSLLYILLLQSLVNEVNIKTYLLGCPVVAAAAVVVSVVGQAESAGQGR